MIDGGRDVRPRCTPPPSARPTRPTSRRSPSHEPAAPASSPRSSCARSRPRWSASRVDDVLLQTLVTLLNLGRPQGRAWRRRPARRRRRPTSSRCGQAIEGARALLPLRRAAPRRAARPGPRRAVAAADGLHAARAGRRRAAGGRAARAAAPASRRTSPPAPRAPARRSRPGASGCPGSSPVACRRRTLPPGASVDSPRSSGGPRAAALALFELFRRGLLPHRPALNLIPEGLPCKIS